MRPTFSTFESRATLFGSRSCCATSSTSPLATLTVTCEDDDAVLRVDNDGPAIAPGQRDEVFDRFTRLDQARGRDSGGSGLGLAIFRTIAHVHGGSAKATQTSEGRCRFEVRLPLRS